MEIRAAQTTIPASARQTAAAATAGQAEEPVYSIQDTMNLITPMELTKGFGGKKIPRGEDRIDVIKEVLQMDKVWSQGFDGKGIGVCIIDTGTYPHPDTKDRIIAFRDFVNDKNEAYDDNGHGTHVSGLIGGNGSKMNGAFKGTAPGCNIIGVKVLDHAGSGSMANVIKGIEWAVENKEKYNIRVVNMSLGGPSNLKEKDDLVALAVKRLNEAGIVPCIAAGNSGPGRETVGFPGNSIYSLTVGAYDDKNTADKKDDTMCYFSSRGPTTRERITKPDIASPGMQLVSLRSPGSDLDHENVTHRGDYYVLLSGTSMATPVLAGIVADVIQANPDMTVAQTIDVMKSTADKMPDIGPYQQGTGLVNPEKAVARALELKAAAAKAAAAQAPQAKVDAQPPAAATETAKV